MSTGRIPGISTDAAHLALLAENKRLRKELAEWEAAWKSFYASWKALRELAKRDGHLLTMDVRLKADGLRNKSDEQQLTGDTK